MLRNAPPSLPVSPASPVTSSVTFPTPVCPCVLDGHTKAQHSSVLWKEHQLLAQAANQPWDTRGLHPQLPPRAPALPVLQQQGAGAPVFQIPLNPAPSQGVGRWSWAEFDFRRAMGHVTALRGKVTRVINNPWPDVEPPPCTAPFLGGQDPTLPTLRLQLCPLWGAGRFGKDSRGEGAAASPCVPLHPLARGCPSGLSWGRAAHGAAVPWAVPASLLPRRGKGETGPHRPLIPLCHQGMAQGDPKARLGAPGEGRLRSRDAPSLLQDEMTAMSTGGMKESLALASRGDGRLYQGWQGGVGWGPAPLTHPECPRQGLESGQELVVGSMCPSQSVPLWRNSLSHSDSARAELSPGLPPTPALPVTRD